MHIFSIALVICISLMSTGCAGRHTTKIPPPAEMEVAHKTIAPSKEECSQLATFSSDVGATHASPVPGWKLVSPVSTYDRESIFDYINGAAELYFAYDFTAVAAAEYQNGETSIMIDVYDMTSPEGAFGIYSLSRYPEASYVDIGNEGILTGTALDFWKGKYFCKVYSFDVAEKYQDDVINFGNRLASKIQKPGEEPAILGSLPQNGLIPRTAKFFSRKLGLDNIRYLSEENVFNLGAGAKGVVAEYQVDDTASFQLFIIEYPSPEEASSAFEIYNSYLGKGAEPLSANETTRRTWRMFRMGGRVAFIGIKDQSLWGFWDVETREAAQSILRDILPFPS
jgi:hypothetical protein